MPRLTIKTPKYRLHKGTGQAVVTLCGRDHYLGKHGSAESKSRYKQIIAEWQLTGHPPSGSATGPTIDELILAYLRHVEEYYVKNGQPTPTQRHIRDALAPLHDLYGPAAATAFGPLALKALRHSMVDRGAWCRSTINKAVGIIKRMFKWGAENELVPAEVFHRLQTVSGLRRGRSQARESIPVRPVDEEYVCAILPHISPQVAAMVQLQMLTGMRPGEVISMRGCDLDTSSETWTYTPPSHKTEHHGKERVIHLGPKAQAVLRPFLQHDLSAFLFSPTDAESDRRSKQHAKRRIPLSCGNRPGTNRRVKPKRKPRECYTVASYRRAIERGCERAFPPPDHLRPQRLENGRTESAETLHARLSAKQKDELKAWHREHRWHPNQLRHTAATRLRKQFGIEAARVVLGHSSAAITEIYAEVDREKASQIMSRVG